MADLLSALLGPGTTPSAGSPATVVGVEPITTAVVALTSAAAKFLASPQGKRLLRGLKDTEEKAARRLKLYKAKAARATSEGARQRWLRRAQRQQERLDSARIEQMLAKRGIVGEGPVTEYKRNLLSAEWDSASADRRKEIEAKITQLDKRLAKLHREQVVLKQALGPPTEQTSGAQGHADIEESAVSEGSRAMVPWGKARREMALQVPPAVRAVQRVANRVLRGTGGFQETVQAPPGPGRLVRIPFYPVNDNASWSGPGGIDFKDDDPVCMLTIAATGQGAAGNRTARPRLLRTERFDYGSYRILGFQVNEQGNYRPAVVGGGGGLMNIGPVVISFWDLSLYNGQNLFLQDDQIWSAQFNMFPSGFDASLTPGAPATSQAFSFPDPGYARRRSRYFIGLRDYPLVTGTTNVSVKVGAFSAFGLTPEGGDVIEIPFTCNIVAEMVEDKVFGNVVNPSPAGRGGAMVKVAARDVGSDEEGREQIELVSARHRQLSTVD